MEIIRFFESDNRESLIALVEAQDWGAARFLAKLLKENTFFDTLGGEGELFVLMDGENPVSFLTLTRQDSVRDETLFPWIGFVYTAPAYRGHRHAGSLLKCAEAEAKKKGYSRVYLGTDHVGLYEKYGYSYLENRFDCWGDDTRILYKDL